MKKTTRHTLTGRMLLVACTLAAFTALGTRAASATELIPSLGVTKSTDSNAGNAQGFAGLALRAPLLPYLNIEGGIAYRQDSFSNDDLKVRQWPVTASLWLVPTPMLYAGGGVGWYRTTYDWNSAVPIRDNTDSKVGVHLGGGADFPLSPKLNLDLNGRYIFMTKSDATLDVPTTFNPDFWTLSAGLAIKF